MEELDLIIQDFEETCSTLAITHDSPSDDGIREKFEEYHKAKLKLLDIHNVSQQRELLYFFAKNWNENQTTGETTINSDDIKNCIEKYNCG